MSPTVEDVDDRDRFVRMRSVTDVSMLTPAQARRVETDLWQQANEIDVNRGEA